MGHCNVLWVIHNCQYLHDHLSHSPKKDAIHQRMMVIVDIWVLYVIHGDITGFL